MLPVDAGTTEISSELFTGMYFSESLGTYFSNFIIFVTSPIFSNLSAVVDLTHAANPLVRITKLRPALQVTSSAGIPLLICFFGDSTSAFAGFIKNIAKDNVKNKTIPNAVLFLISQFIILFSFFLLNRLMISHTFDLRYTRIN